MPKKDTTKTSTNLTDEPYRPAFGESNTYDRKTLYKQVWSEPVSSVAPKYGITDVALRKICKKLNVPLPPRGYWAKKQAGHNVEKPPLPDTDGKSYVFGARTYHGTKRVRTKENILDFLTTEEQITVMRVIEDQQSLAYHPIHPIIQNHIKEIKKNQKNTYFRNHFEDISEEQLSRACRIVSTFFYAVEQSDGNVNQDMTLQILGQRIVYNIHEMQDVVPHALTEDEIRQQQLYEKAQREGSHYPQPKIQKHDYIYNGRLRMCINGYRHYRDSQKSKLEDLLGELLIDAFQAADDKQKRAALEKGRNNATAVEKEVGPTTQYNEEVDRVKALVNIADDFDTAQKIRAYIRSVESQPSLSEDQIRWIEWAKRKADWFDPTVSRVDEVLGTREHSSGSKDKMIEHK